MMKTVLKILLAITLLFFAAFYAGSFFTREYVKDNVEALTNIGISNPETFSHRELNEFPLNVQKYLKLSVEEGIEIPQFVKIKLKGHFKTDLKSEFKKLTAEEYFSVNKPGFVWNAKISASTFYWIRAVETYLGGSGSILIKLLSSINITELTGNEIDISSLIRYYSEAVLFPTVFLDNNISWTYKNPKHSSAVFRIDDMKFKMDFFFNRRGLIERVESSDRFRTTKTGFQKSVYAVNYSDYKKIDGFLIPTKIEVQWKLPANDFTYGIFKIVSIDYKNPTL